MFFSDLPENYTKVSYRKIDPVVRELPPIKIEKSKNYSRTFKIIGLIALTGAAYFGLDSFIYAAGVGGIDEKAERLYFDTFIRIAKWVIIAKGGWDIVAKTLKEDFDGAKRSILQYMMIFAVLMGLPWGLGIVEDIFKEEA
ncbi:hypothetical protein SFC08_01710 [Lysinibacillus halotolerans]